MQKGRKLAIGVIVLVAIGIAITALVIWAWPTSSIPSDHEGRTTCFECHETGVGDAPVLPQSHLDKIEAGNLSDDIDDCLECHDWE